jgi:hypothetical protein
MKLGALDISTVKLGTNQVQAVYQGANLVWQNAPVATAATGVGQTSFTANWNAYSGATYYLLDVSESSDFSTFVYENQIVEAPATSYVVIGLNSNTTYYYRVRASDEDPDAAAFFARVTSAGGTLSTTEQDAILTLVADLKDDGIWSSMKAIYPMVGASAAACAQNLKSSSFTGTFTSGWTFASTGATPNGTSTFMNTQLSAVVELNPNSSHLSYYSRNLNTSAGFNVLMGISDTTCYMQGPSNIQVQGALGSIQTTILSSNTPVGFLVVNKKSSTAQQARKNNIFVETTVTTTAYVNTGQNIFIGNYQNSATFGTNSECAFSSIGDGLTDTEASTFTPQYKHFKQL